LIWDKRDRRDSLDNFLKTSFAEIKNDSIHNLIIDIRNDLGGSSILAEDILDYIANKPYDLSIGSEYFDHGKLIRHSDTTLHNPERLANKFFGETILLTNVATASSAQMMAAGFEYYHLGKVVGQISFEPLFITGEVKGKKLPHTGYFFIYPTKNFILPGYHENRKEYLVPDYVVNPSLKDIMNKKRPIFNFAIDLF
jgi:hypothetical protein